MKIYRVTGVVVVRADDRLIVQVSGLSASPGWTAISLKVDDPNPEDRVLEFALDGTAPGGITIQVLTPVSASVVVPAENVDAILVKARTNSVEVHASEFQAVGKPITTFAIGEEGPLPTTERIGEEGPPITTLRLGEEGRPPITLLFPAAEDPTRLFVENDPTFKFGEGPLGTDIRLDDPAAFAAASGLTTLAVGEEGGPVDPRTLGQGTPFGGF